MAIEWHDIAVPAGWERQTGHPAIVDPRECKDDDASICLSEDMFSFVRGKLCLDVGWSPDGNLAGEYVCRIVEGDDWDRPLEMYCTRDPQNVQWFVKYATAKYPRA